MNWNAKHINCPVCGETIWYSSTDDPIDPDDETNLISAARERERRRQEHADLYAKFEREYEERELARFRAEMDAWITADVG